MIQENKIHFKYIKKIQNKIKFQNKSKNGKIENAAGSI